MSIHKIESFSLTCNHCGETLITHHDGFSIFSDEDNAHEAADNEGWYWEEGRDGDDDHYYCKECHWIDDNDEMHLRMERRNINRGKGYAPPSPKDQPHEPISYGGYARDPEVNPSLKRAQEAEFKQGEIPEEIMEWIGQKADEKFPIHSVMPDHVKEEQAVCNALFGEAMEMMYHKMQEEIAKLRATCFDYQERYNEANKVAEHERMVSYKLREEIAVYKEMWMIADKTMNELRLKVQELNKVTNG